MQEYWTFPGDDGLDYAAVWRVPDRYLVVAEYARTAAVSFGIVISLQTMERWFRLMACSYLLDQLLDDTPSEHYETAGDLYRRIVYGEAIDENWPSWINPDLFAVAALLSNSLQEIGPSSEFYRLAMSFPEHAVLKAAERRVWRYGRRVTVEGRHMGLLIAECATIQERQTRQYRRFQWWMSTLGGGGTLLDGSADLGADFKHHRTQISPTPKNRLKLGLYCVAVSVRLGLNPRVLSSVILSIPRFWGAPFGLKHEPWGRPAAAWRVKIEQARNCAR